jgi:hypothetical protein
MSKSYDLTFAVRLIYNDSTAIWRAQDGWSAATGEGGTPTDAVAKYFAELGATAKEGYRPHRARFEPRSEKDGWYLAEPQP